jgi:HD-GYP domain-containing protein (c-di-GMP phosphodiesterase class II)
MLRLHHIHAEPGMVVAADVRHPRHSHIILLRPGAVLDRPAIAHLREIRVREIWIKYPSMARIGATYSQDVSNASREVTTRFGKVMDDFVADRHAKLDYNMFRDAIAAMLDALAASPKAAIYVMEAADAATPHVRHAANTCFLSMLMGLKLDFYLVRERGRLSPSFAQDLTALGAGAMLHDIGLLSLPDDVLARYEETGDTTDTAWQEHTRLGFAALRTEFEAAVGAIALHHHQHYDGTGFPSRTMLDGRVVAPSGSDIHIFARVVAVADMLDRLRFPGHTTISPPRLEPAMPVVRALKLMIDSTLTPRFDPVVLRALLSVVPPFAPGSMVTLSNGKRAMVASWSPLDPCRPAVELISETGGRWWENPPKERLDLQQDESISIVKCDEIDVREDLFYPASPREFDSVQALGAIKLAA